MSRVSNRALGLLVVASVVYYVLVVSAMHLLEPEFSPIRAPMSAYVLGPYGPLMTTTYFVLSAGLLGVAYGVVTTLRRTLNRIAAIARQNEAALLKAWHEYFNRSDGSGGGQEGQGH